ncbi:MAG TPA: SHOCT domain-containing protein [Vicinamibacterales bacterium]
MKRNGALAVLGIAVAGAALAAVGLIAYNMGVTNAGDGGHVAFGPMMRGYRGMEFGMGAGGWWGIIPALVVGLVIVLVVVALLVGAGRSAPSPALKPSSDPPSGLRELVEMHDRGALTEEEFAAAKRKLLGL